MKRINHKTGQNPNTVEFYEEFYASKTVAKERANEWMYRSLLDYAPKQGEVLEVGCGFGKDLRWLQGKNPECTYVGVEFIQSAIDKAKEAYMPFINFYKQSVFDLKPAIADFIICSQCLEHMDDPAGACAAMKRALKANGKLFITVPTCYGTLARVKMHVWTFIPQDFIKMLGPNTLIKEIDRSHLLAVWKKK